MPIENRNLAPGTRLVATYKKLVREAIEARLRDAKA